MGVKTCIFCGGDRILSTRMLELPIDKNTMGCETCEAVWRRRNETEIEIQHLGTRKILNLDHLKAFLEQTGPRKEKG